VTPVSPEQILAATQAAQFVIAVIIAAACIILWCGAAQPENIRPLFICLGLFLFVVLGASTLTDEAAMTRTSLFSIDFFPTVPGIRAVQCILWLDLICGMVLVMASGGSVSSCFSPLFFLMPTIAILLLRDQKNFLTTYIFAVSGCFLCSLIFHRQDFFSYPNQEERAAFEANNKIAFGCVTLACFFLSLHISETAKTRAAPRPSWTLFASSDLPPGKDFSLQDAVKLNDREQVKERLYLSGDFLVRASSDEVAVLRSRSEPQLARVVVRYPALLHPPREGIAFTRDKSHPFQITEARHERDGSISIYAQ